MWPIEVIALACLLACTFSTPAMAAQHTEAPTPEAKTADSSELLKVIVVSRHGIRAPLQTQAELAQYSSDTWPQWSVPPGDLTLQGSQTMQALGKFYAAYYEPEELFAGSGCDRIRNSFVWSDVDERDIATARSFFEGLAPNCTISVHTVNKGEVDPYQHPLKAHLGHPDRALALAAVQGRIGGEAAFVLEANLPAFRTLDRVLGGCVTAHCTAEKGTRVPLYAMPATIQSADDDDHLIAEASGPLGIASTLSEIFQLEYAEGKPMNQVGFGRLSRADLTQILSLHSLFFDLANETPYIAQVQASNLSAAPLIARQLLARPLHRRRWRPALLQPGLCFSQRMTPTSPASRVFCGQSGMFPVPRRTQRFPVVDSSSSCADGEPMEACGCERSTSARPWTSSVRTPISA
jgi:4-phytase/acid phosphatase